MSSKLTIEPYNRKKVTLSTDLKFALRKGNNNESINERIIGKEQLSYFQGLRDAGVEDAEIVISMIGKYGECVITEEF
jgi:hypothetical protein